jgi:copper chaperone CopZ
MQTEVFKVAGMTCGGCTGAVSKALRKEAGVDAAEVSLASEEATVRYDEGVTSLEQLKAAVTAAGYGVDVADSTQSGRSKKGCCG